MDNWKLNAIRDEFDVLVRKVEIMRRDRTMEMFDYNCLIESINRIEKLLKGE